MSSINYYISIALYTVTFLYIHFSDTLKAYIIIIKFTLACERQLEYNVEMV